MATGRRRRLRRYAGGTLFVCLVVALAMGAAAVAQRRRACPNHPPKPGRYVYSLAIGGPRGAKVIEVVSKHACVYWTKITNSQNANTALVRRQWRRRGIYLLSVQTSVASAGPGLCVYTPPVRQIPYPLAKRNLSVQQWSSDTCSGATKIRVIGRTTTRDARGRPWRVWRIIEETGTFDVQVHYFSPELGMDVRNDHTSAQGRTLEVLRDYP